MMFNIIGKRLWFFLASTVLVIASIGALATFGLKPGIEFKSGSMLTVSFETPVDYTQFKLEMTDLGYKDAIVQTTSAGDFLIITHELTDEEKAQLEAGLTAKFGTLTESEFNSVSPQVASETARNAIIAVAVAMVGILLYVTWAFRKMPSPFRYGTCAIVAVFHDILVTAGIFAIFGAILNWEINLMFITGLLTIVGYSINNTIVVFDRIRENQAKGAVFGFENVANNSIVETMGRSFNTSITTLIVVLALLLFVGATIQNFAVVLLIGVIVGTYDSVFVAPGLLVVWNGGGWGRLTGRKQITAAESKASG